MRASVLGGVVLAGLVGSTVVLGVQGARASESYEKATGLKCEHCHKHTKEEFKKLNITGWDGTQDYKECGKAADAFLRKQPGFKPLQKGQKRSVADTKKWADLLVDEDWKCKHQSKAGQQVK